MNILKKILQHNLFATLFLNFRMLPFRQAIHLPLDVYHKVRFDCLSGRIILNTGRVYRGMVKIGGRGSDIFPRRETVMSIAGTVSFGGKTEIGNGVSFVVLREGMVRMGDKVRIGAYSRLYCAKSITMGDDVGVSWDCQILDTNFHDMEDMTAARLIQRDSPIVIGSSTWIGNRSNIMKGTVLPDCVTVASNSLTNRDYRNVERYSVLAGMPAKVVRTGVRRIND